MQDVMQTTFEAIRDQVSRVGYCHLSEGWEEGRFRDLCLDFGEIFYEADVKMGGDRPRNYQLPEAIGFHTDHVTAQTVAWFCLIPDANGGAMQLLDLDIARAQMSDAELNALCRVGVTDNAAWGGGEPIALCEPVGEGVRFHYVPWLRMYPADAEAGRALEKFNDLVDEAITSELIDIDLAPGDIVVVDNYRVAHGRRAISGTSQRHLKRFWMRRPGPQETTA